MTSFQSLPASSPLPDAAPLEKLKGLSPVVLASDVGLEMRRQSKNLIAAMDTFEAGLMQDWCAQATAVSEQKLCQPVFRCALHPALLSVGAGLHCLA
jgi:hypothetical protein